MLDPSPVSGRIEAALALKLRQGADAPAIAADIAAVLAAIVFHLSPIIGRAGVAALYRRSLHLVGLAHPWLVPSNADPHGEIDIAALRVLLARRSAIAAVSAGGALLQTYADLLTSLVGASLAAQLLGPALDGLLPPITD